MSQSSSFASYLPHCAVAASSQGSTNFLTQIASIPINQSLAQSNQTLGLASAASADSRLLACASNPDYVIRLYAYNGATRTLAAQQVLSGHQRTIRDIRFGQPLDHPHLLLSAAEDGYVVCWDLRSGNPTYQLFEQGVAGPMLSCDVAGNYIAGGGDNGIYLWDIRSAKFLMHNFDLHSRSPVGCVRFRPDVQTPQLFTASDDGLINIFNIDGTSSSFEDIFEGSIPTESPIASFGFLSGSNSHCVYALSTVETLSLWNADTSERLASFPSLRDDLNALVITSLGLPQGQLDEDSKDNGGNDTSSNTITDSNDVDVFDTVEVDPSTTISYDDHGNTMFYFANSLSSSTSSSSSSLLSSSSSSEQKASSDRPVPPSAWRVTGLIGCSNDTASSSSSTTTASTSSSDGLTLFASTSGGGLVVASITPQGITPQSVLPPRLGHVEVVRDCIWSPRQDMPLFTCGQDGRLVVSFDSSASTTGSLVTGRVNLKKSKAKGGDDDDDTMVDDHSSSSSRHRHRGKGAAAASSAMLRKARSTDDDEVT